MLIQSGDLAIRRMRDDPQDYERMARWLTDPRVLTFYEGRDNPFPLERVKEKYGPRARGEDQVTPCILEYQGQAIGYMQYYPLVEADRDAYGLEMTASLTGVYGTDMFIGEPDLWNKGLGTQALAALLRYLFAEHHAVQVVIDPQAWNTRAIRCYEKCGFRKVKLLPRHELHEGAYRDAWLMTIDRHARKG
ncbi:MAG: acetyltransferase [Chloroflexi bacterium]|nr:acetyltransferase [Chloroflexota bacterium]